jgi:hypothetical protein
MRTEADQARANAIALEVKKDGLRQRQSGDWVLSLVIAAVHMDARITGAAMGTRYQCALVEVNDDETPVQDPEKQKWRDLGPVKQAALRCRDPVFWAFLKEEKKLRAHSQDEAADIVRLLCAVSSRADLAINASARVTWNGLDDHFQAWKAAQNG